MIPDAVGLQDLSRAVRASQRPLSGEFFAAGLLSADESRASLSTQFDVRRRVLDVGCGTGQLLADIRDRFPTTQVHGLDLCDGMIRSAKTLLGSGADLTQGESQSLPFPDDHFDLVVCTHCFHHFPDPLRSVREMARVLRHGGMAMVLDGDRDGLWGRLLYDTFVVWAEGPVTHHSASAMQRLLRDAGLVLIEQVRAFPLSPVLLTIGRAEKSPA